MFIGGGNRNAPILECSYAATDDFRSGTTGCTTSFRDSLLRTNWIGSSRPESERAETIRNYCALWNGTHSVGKETGIYAGCNPSACLRFSQCHSRLGTLANAFSEKARGTRRFDGRDKNRAALAEKDDAKLPLRHSGAMWQGGISERLPRCCAEISAFETSTKAMSTLDMWNWLRSPGTPQSEHLALVALSPGPLGSNPEVSREKATSRWHRQREVIPSGNSWFPKRRKHPMPPLTSRRHFLSAIGGAAASSLLCRSDVFGASALSVRSSRFKLSVITHEITQDFGHSLEIASQAFGLPYVELRGLWRKNVINLDEKETAAARRLLQKFGLQVADIASPLFKTDWPGAPTCKYRPKAPQFGADYRFAQQREVLERSLSIPTAL